MVEIVVGASGFIGTRLVDRLASREGRKVVAMDIAPPRQRVEGVRYIIADVRQELDPEPCLGAEAVYNLAAVHRTPGHPGEDYFHTNIAGALKVTQLASRLGVQLMVFTSSISVYGPCEETMHEGSRLSPQSPYGQSKALAEEIHRRWREAGVGRRLVIARPGVVFGPGERGNYTALANALRKGYFAYPGKRTTVKSGGYVDELLDAITFAISKDAPEVLFNFAYPDTSTTEDIVSTMGGVMGRRFRPPTAPAALLRMAAHLLKPMRHFGVPNSIAPERVLKLVQSTKIEPRWLKDNGYAFRTDLRRALELWRDETSGRFD